MAVFIVCIPIPNANSNVSYKFTKSSQSVEITDSNIKVIDSQTYAVICSGIKLKITKSADNVISLDMLVTTNGVKDTVTCVDVKIDKVYLDTTMYFHDRKIAENVNANLIKISSRSNQ